MDKTLNWNKCTVCWDKGYYYDFAECDVVEMYKHATRISCDCYVGKLRKQSEEQPIEI